MQRLRRWPVALRYAAGGGLAVGALGIRLTLDGIFGPYPFLSFFVATILSGSLLGRGPGLLTALLSAGLARWFLLDPRHSLTVLDPEQAVALAVFLAITISIALVFDALFSMIERVSAAEQRLRAIFDGTFEFIGLLARDGRLLEANVSALRFGGFARDDVVGRPFWEAPWWSLSQQTRKDLRQAVERAAQGDFVRYEVDVCGANGRVVTIDFSLAPITDEAGRVSLIVPEGRDITLQRRAEQERKQAADRLNDAFESISDAVAILDRNWRIVYMNQRARDLVSEGRSLIGMDHWQAFPESVGTRIEREYRAAVADQQVRRFEEWYEPLAKWFRINVCPTAEGLAIYFQDVTEQRRKDEALRASEALYRSLAANLPNGAAFVVDHDLRYLLAEGSALHAAGFTAADLEGKTLHEALPSDLADRYVPHYRQVLAGGSFVWEHDSHGRSYASHGVPLRDGRGAICAALAVSYDITERKRTEEALREGEALLASVYAGVEVAITLAEASDDGEDFRFIRANRAAAAWSGIPEADWIGKRPRDILPAAEAAALVARYQQAMREDKPIEYEELLTLPTGSFCAFTTVCPLPNTSGSGRRVVVTSMNINARKAAEEALRASEAKARARADEIQAIYDGAPIGIVLFDADFRFIRINERLARINGRPYADYLGQGIEDVLPARTAAALREIQPRLLAGEEIVDLEITSPNGVTGEDGTFLVTFRPLRDARGEVKRFLGTVLDITARKRAREHQSLLVGELNHRVKNVLATVQAIANQTFRGAAVTSEACQTFDGRLLGLARAHELLTRADWREAGLRDVIVQALTPFHGAPASRFDIRGSDVRLPPKAALAFSMAFHELATNAVKYGALSNATGRVAITWRVEAGTDCERLHLSWRESDGPPVQPPERRGFGSMMIEHVLA